MKWALIDVEEMLRDCIPGGELCDPQYVADQIRSYVAAQAQTTPAQEHADELLAALQHVLPHVGIGYSSVQRYAVRGPACTVLDKCQPAGRWSA